VRQLVIKVLNVYRYLFSDLIFLKNPFGEGHTAFEAVNEFTPSHCTFIIPYGWNFQWHICM